MRMRSLYLPGVGALALALPGCFITDKLDVVEIPEANDWNLSQLHKPSGSYNYTVDLTGDVEYALRSGASGLPFKTKEERRLGNRKKAIANPAEETLVNLLDLERFEAEDEFIAGLQSMWFCRLAVDDSSALARERCVLALGPLGKRVGVGLPVPLPPDAQPAGAAELGPPITELIRQFRTLRESRDAHPDSVAALDAACVAIEELVLDLEGGRRVQYVANQLLRGLDGKGAAAPPLERLSRSTQRRCIELALAEALGDPSPIVRAGAIEACVRASGTQVLAPILLQLDREPSDVVAVRVMDLLAENGLPDAPPDMDAETYARARESWVGRVYEIAVDHPDGHVRVHAMRALDAVLHAGLQSLREEDWERWWMSREPAVPASGPEGSGA